MGKAAEGVSDDMRLAEELLCARPRPVSTDESDAVGLRSGTMPATQQITRSRAASHAQEAVQAPPFLPALQPTAGWLFPHAPACS